MPLPVQVRRFRVVWPLIVVACVGVAVLLQPGLLDAELRRSASGAALAVGGVFVAVSAGLRSRTTVGRRRCSWRLITLGVLIALIGNVWASAIGSDPVTSPSVVSDLAIMVALMLGIAAMLLFPTLPRRGVHQVVMTLDGLVVGGAVLVVASTLVYDEVLDQHRGSLATRVSTLLIPVLDVVLIVVSLLLLLRSRGADRQALGLLAMGFVAYAVSDLSFAVLVARSDFEFGTPLDLGWIVGYALLSLASWYPSVEVEAPTTSADGAGRRGEAAADVLDAALVYLVLLVAATVQASGGFGKGAGARVAVLWLVIIAAAAARQVVLTRDNDVLRRGLEQRVREQTADLRRLARQTEVLLTSTRDGIYGVDADGRLTFVNPSGAGALGYAAEDLQGRRAHALFHATGDDGAPLPYAGCYIAEAIGTGAVAAAEEDVYVRADGSTFPVEISASPLLDDDVVRGAVVVFRDVTQRREVDRMKSEFISVVSHELRTPLTSIRGSLGLLASGKLGELTPRAGSMATLALQSSERLTRLINDILDLERIESGTRPMGIAPVEAASLLARSAAEMAGHARSCGVHVEAQDGAGWVLADGDRIVQTLTNLLSNAIKFSEAGQSVVLDASPEDGEVVFTVRDHGRGIPAEKLETIFQRFEQVDSSDARQKGGAGLGLAISRSIVTRHGGRIWAHSAAGEGTTMSFTLPATHRGHGRVAAEPDRAGPAAPVGRGGSVLLVEDDDDLADVLRTLLTGHAIRVARAAGVREALELAESARPRLVILDVALPDGTGQELVAALRRRPETADLPLIVYSADDVEADDRPALTLGRTVFVTKGRVDPADVEDRVLEMLGRHQPSTSGGDPA